MLNHDATRFITPALFVFGILILIGCNSPSVNSPARDGAVISVVPTAPSPSVVSGSISEPANATVNSMPTGVLTFSATPSGGGLFSLFDYDLSTRKLTDYGEGMDAYRVKSGSAVVSVRNSGVKLRRDIVVVSPDGKIRKKVVENLLEPCYFLLSQDARTLVYEKGEYVTKPGFRQNDLYRQSTIIYHNLETGEERREAFTTFDMNLEPHDTATTYIPTDWTPDGRLLITLFPQKQRKTSKGKQVPVHYLIASLDFKNLYTVDIAQPGAKPVESIAYPTVSPDGKRIAFSWDHHIWVADIDGYNPKQVTESQASEHFPAWSPDGKWLAVGFGTDTSKGVYLVPVDGKVHRIHVTDHSILSLQDTKGEPVMCVGRITWWPSK